MGFANAGRRAAGDRYAFPLASYEDLSSLSTREVNNAREVAANPTGVSLSLSIAVSVSVGCAIFTDIHGIRGSSIKIRRPWGTDNPEIQGRDSQLLGAY